jgi:integrase
MRVGKQASSKRPLIGGPGTDFVFPSRLYGGRKALDLAAVLKRKIRPTFDKLGITGVGWHIFRHTVGTVLAELGEHQLTIRDYLRHSNLSVTNKLPAATLIGPLSDPRPLP